MLSRSVGLPGFTDDVGEWSEAPGLASMVVESLLVFLTGAVLVTRRYPMGSGAAAGGATDAPAPGGTGAMRAGPSIG